MRPAAVVLAVLLLAAPAPADEIADLQRTTGDTVAAGADQQMDGGYRGMIHLVPELPVGRYHQHLVWVAAAAASFDQFFAALYPPGTPPPAYRWRDLQFLFVRSVGKRTPSAFTSGWTITYNVAGSLLTSAEGVRATLVHELFHANDEAHGDWSARALATDFDAIVTRCGPNPTRACLAPYAPNRTIVRGGTYYAFQPNNGVTVHEYAAELAVRYVDEQRAMLADGKLARPAFKCGPPENARAWHALITEFFAGRDLVPACPGAMQ